MSEVVGETLFDAKPLVTVGMPCYNRVDDFRTAINDVLSQTYRNLEIIVSDNCSDSLEIESIALEYAASDDRIVFYRQERNIGPSENNKFIMRRAKGELFMFATDDDRWHPEFIEVCLKNMSVGSTFSVMTDYYMENRAQGWLRKSPVFPVLDPARSIVTNIFKFSNSSTDVILYGLHNRKIIEMFLELEFTEDFNDPLVGYYFALKVIVENGFKTISEPMFIWRCDVQKNSQRYGPPYYEYQFSMFARKSIEFLLGSAKLSNPQKIMAVFSFLFGFWRRFLWIEMQQGESTRARILRYALLPIKKPIQYLVIRRRKAVNKNIQSFVA